MLHPRSETLEKPLRSRNTPIRHARTWLTAILTPDSIKVETGLSHHLLGDFAGPRPSFSEAHNVLKQSSGRLQPLRRARTQAESGLTDHRGIASRVGIEPPDPFRRDVATPRITLKVGKALTDSQTTQHGRCEWV